ncbi:helix-turn-helix domain-containing protein [Patescibacteria group bacterium]|nr:helix-turn-helix domain-containing protein [Patescibacteria group bacterium]
MARFRDRQKAIQLRIKGKSYSQIKKIIGVSKSTLSYWLKDHPLSEERIRELKSDPRRIEKYRATRLRQKQERFNKVYEKEKKNTRPFSKRDLFIAGLFLYWGEGGKTKYSELCVSNTNPAVIKFFLKWLKESLNVPKEKIKIRLHLYRDMSIKKEINFWAKELTIPKNQFRKPYIKKSNRESITYKTKFHHGTCNAIVDDVNVAQKVFANLRIIEDKLNSGYNL